MAMTDEELGISPLTLPTYPPEKKYAPGLKDRLLEAIYNGMSGIQFAQPRGGSESFLSGLTGSLAGQGGRVASGRQKFEARQEARRLKADEDRRKATEEYNKRHETALGKIGDEERKKIEVTPEMRTQFPTIPERYLGKSVNKDVLDIYTKPKASSEKPETGLAVIDTPQGPRYVRPSAALGKAPPPKAGEGPKPPTATERENLASDSSALTQTDEISKMFKPEFVGPVTGRMGQARMTTGFGLQPGEADFRGALAIYRNSVINRLSGSAVSVGEQARMVQQIPDLLDPPEAFKSKLKQTRRNIDRIARERRKTYSQTGLDLSGLEALPTGAEEDPNAAYVRSLGLGGH